MIKSIILLFVFVSYIRSLFVIVYLQVKPFKGMRVIKKSNQYITSIDSNSFDEIKKFRQRQMHLHKSIEKTVPDILMNFEDVSLPQSIKVEYVFPNEQSNIVKISLYMNIIVTVKSIEDIKQLNTPCIYLGRVEQKSSEAEEKWQNICARCSFEADLFQYNAKNLEKQLKACADEEKTNQYLNQWLELKIFKQNSSVKQPKHEGSPSLYLKTLYKIVIILVFITIMIIKYEMQHPMKDIAEI